MKRKIGITVLLLGILAISFHMFRIGWPYFEYQRLPRTEEVLANPSVKPATIGDIKIEGKQLCVSVKLYPLFKPNPKQDIYQITAEQWPDLDRAYMQTVHFYVNDWRQSITYVSLLLHYHSADSCVDLDKHGIGLHVAHVSFEAPLGQVHQYTWVFEVTADGVVPEVTAGRGGEEVCCGSPDARFAGDPER